MFFLAILLLRKSIYWLQQQQQRQEQRQEQQQEQQHQRQHPQHLYQNNNNNSNKNSKTYIVHAVQTHTQSYMKIFVLS